MLRLDDGRTTVGQGYLTLDHTYHRGRGTPMERIEKVVPSCLKVGFVLTHVEGNVGLPITY